MNIKKTTPLHTASDINLCIVSKHIITIEKLITLLLICSYICYVFFSRRSFARSPANIAACIRFEETNNMMIKKNVVALQQCNYV